MQAETRTTEADRINEGRESHDFGCTDSRGRAIGATIDFFTVVMVDAGPDARAVWSTIPAGTWFCFIPQATRNGAAFGASQYPSRFSTEAGRTAAVDRYLASARKRAAKVSA